MWLRVKFMTWASFDHPNIEDANRTRASSTQAEHQGGALRALARVLVLLKKR
jgi:hypothetical protein